jgi:4-amino-4-deoxy-L-arabinose transferase-like glycosyltransferase
MPSDAYEAHSPGAGSSGLKEQSPLRGLNYSLKGFVLSARSLSSALLGLGLGLYLSRVVAEGTATTWPWLGSLALIIGCSIIGVGLAALGHRYGLTLVPLATLYAYVLYPRIEPALAWSVAFVAVAAQAIAVATAVIANVKGKRSFPVDPIVFILGLGLYVYTLAPTVLSSNSGEFQFVADVLGIAHPPGYPLYTVLGKLFTLIPIGDVAYRVNLMSAFFAALTLALVSRTVRRVTDSALGGIVGALALGTATTFWAQATTANTRSLTAFFAALALFALIRYANERREVHLILFALAFGLGITHHGSLVFLTLPFIAFLLVTDISLFTKVRPLLKPLLAFLLSLSVLLYLPVRGALGAPFGPPDIATLEGFSNHVLARGFRGDMFYFARSGVLFERFGVVANILDFQFGLGLLVAAAFGALIMLRRDWRLLLLCGGAVAVHAFVTITYRAPETVEYLIPAYVPLAIIIGYGAGVLGRWSRFKALNACLVSLFMLLGVIQLVQRYPSFAWLSDDRSARQYAESVMSNAPPEALILANWHWATPLWYLQYSEGVRPDVEVRYVYPEGAEPISATWLRRIEENVGERPLIATNYYQEFGATPYRFVPLGEAFLVQSAPLLDIPSDAVVLGVAFEDKIRLLGHRLLEDSVSSGQPLYLDLYWQPTVELSGNYSFFVHLVGDGGQVLGQMDVTHDMTGLKAGEISIDRYEIRVLPTIPSGSYTLIAGVYITLPEGGWQRLTTQEGREAVPLAEVQVVPPALRPVTLHPLHQPFADGLTLIGVDYDTSLEGARRVYLHWHRFRASNGDYDVLLYGGDSLLARSRLPQVPLGTYLTTAHDLPLIGLPLQVELRSASDVVSRRLGPWGWTKGGRLVLPIPSPQSHYVDLGGEMLLAGVEYRRSPKLQPGDTVKVELRLVAKKPILHDYVVSVRLTDEAGRLLSQDDTVPALGAIPTLKWIRGSSIGDAHFVRVPIGAQAGTLKLSLIVYDAFTMRPLGVLDDRLVKLGPSVPLARLELGEDGSER